MVLPGVSGSYMLLIMDQYERVVGSIDDRNLKIIAPVGIGAILGVIGLSHLLKLLLHRFAKPTIRCVARDPARLCYWIVAVQPGAGG